MTTLYYKEGTSDKVYQAQIVPNGDLYDVTFAYGRRGSTMTTGKKNTTPLGAVEASDVYNKLIREKMAKGYTEGIDGAAYTATADEERNTGILPMLLNSIDESALDYYMHRPDWVAEEKFDGRRMMLRKKPDGTVEAIGLRSTRVRNLDGFLVSLRLVGDPAEAEDLALETFYRLHTHHHDFGTDFNTGGWLHRVAINLGLHSLRSYKRRERYELAAGQRAIKEAPENRPAEIMAVEENKQAARAILAGMPERQARILIMRYSGASYKEIATALGVSTASIGPTLLRAEKEFEKRYRALNREEI